MTVLCAAVFFLPRTSYAQPAIAGVVKDTSGAVMPGVLVEASSPALIEKTRSVVTDSAGQYKIVELTPGTYEVSFTLAGFKVVRRGNIVLEGNFTPTVNAELQVGSLSEVLTVTAEAPTVDLVNNTATFVANRDVLDAIPTTDRSTTSRALLIPGTTVTPFVLGQFNLTSHGSSTSDFTIAIDGLRVNNLCGSGQYSGFYMNDASVQELTYSTGAESAEIQSSGIRVNSVPKDGGNKFSGSFFLYGQGSSLQSDNRSDAMKAIQANGLPLITIAGTAYDWQINPSFGGPLAKDKLWFYFTYKYQDNKFYVPSAHFSDGSQAYRNSMGNYSGVGRLTWAASSKDRVRLYIEKQFNGEFYNGFNTYAVSTPEASTDAFGRGWIPQVRWTRAQSNKLLLEAGISYYNQPYEQDCRASVKPTDLPVFNASTGLLSGACGYTIPPYSSTTKDYSTMASASYVTGSHAIKVGMTDGWGQNSRTFSPNANIDALIKVNVPGLNDFPFAVVVYNSPASAVQNVNSDFGSYAQDTWTMKRITLNYGARFEHFNASIPAESSAASTWIGARNFAAIPDVPNWNDWAVRFAAAYDLFGNGKTALKANVGKYVASQAAGYAQNFNGMSGTTQQVTWNDLDHNGTILDAAGNIEVNEVGPRAANFGQITVRPDPALARPYNWEYSAAVQHELLPRTSVTVGFYHRDFYNLQVYDNQNVSQADWAAFSIATPTDPRLPLSGQPIPIYTLNPAKVGVAIDNLYTYSTQNKSAYNGFEVSANIRRDKFLLFGGLTTDRLITSSCDGSTGTQDLSARGSSARDNPNSLRFCDVNLATSGQPAGVFKTTVKASAAYSFPYDIQLSGSFSSIPGPGIRADYTVTSAIAGRPIIGSTTGVASTIVNLVEPNSLFLPYQNRLDMRIGKTFKLDRAKIQGFADVFNVLNAGTVMAVNQTYGAVAATNGWMTPTQIMQGRFVRFGMQMNF
ncbi:MAG TPA: carboxypeptidase-like regulatory domain-containing protein [Vicinamibacterales bacterium]|nr:carboxypeptidase-like regulatory domain-containing protein [Vicinamibacterales bacterium]